MIILERNKSKSGNRGGRAPKVTGIVAVAVSHQGIELARVAADTTQEAMREIDRLAPDSWAATVRADRTSDGTFFGPGGGRLLASRNGGGWFVE